MGEEKPIEDKEEKCEEKGELVENVTELEKERVPIKIEHIEELPCSNSREETLKLKLAKANEKVYKWMAGIGPNEIEGTIGDWDKISLLKMVEMANQEIREHPEKSNIVNSFKSVN
jgi:hypothetical protein